MWSIHRHLYLLSILLVGVPGVNAASDLETAKKEGSVVFYSAMSADHVEKLREAFERKYPFIKVNALRGNSERIQSRVLTEARAGTQLADVISNDGFSSWVLREKGLLQSYKSKETEAVPQQFRDPEGLMSCCLYILTNVIGYHTGLVGKKDIPKTYEDLLDPKWRGKLGMDADEVEWFAVLLHLWGKERAINYLQALMKQKPILRRGHTLQTQLLAAGEFPIAVNLFGYRVLEFQERGASVDIIHADPVVVQMNYLMLAGKAPHPHAGMLFIDYVLSQEGQALVAGLGRTVLRPGVKSRHSRLTEGVNLHPMKPEYAKSLDEVSKLYYSIVK
jgi:iron(III) transport system substrate-binding protein